MAKLDENVDIASQLPCYSVIFQILQLYLLWPSLWRYTQAKKPAFFPSTYITNSRGKFDSCLYSPFVFTLPKVFSSIATWKHYKFEIYLIKCMYFHTVNLQNILQVSYSENTTIIPTYVGTHLGNNQRHADKTKRGVIPQSHVLDMIQRYIHNLFSITVIQYYIKRFKLSRVYFQGTNLLKKYNYIITVFTLQINYLSAILLLNQYLLDVKLSSLSLHEMDPENYYMHVFNNTEHKNVTFLQIQTCTCMYVI